MTTLKSWLLCFPRSVSREGSKRSYFCFFLASCLPYIPEKGTVGASGDLAPLSHLALGLIGEGKMWSPKSGWADAKYVRFMQLIVYFFSAC